MKYKSYLLTAILGVGLMAGVSTASAYTGQGTMKGNDLDITYPIVFTQRPYAQRRINDYLYRLVKDTFDSYADKEFVSAYMDYKVTYEDDDVISLLIHVSRYPDKAAHNWNETYGLVYNKRTGSRIPLSHYVRIKDAAQLQKALEEGKVQELDEAGNPQTFYKDDMFGVSELTDSYVLRKHGNIDLVYGPYGLGPYAAGTMTIPLNREAVAYFNGLNK